MTQQADGAAQNSVCELLDMGAFYLAEFADGCCRPIEGSAVHGGVHVLQIMPFTLQDRLLFLPPLSQSLKVCASMALLQK